MIKGKKIKIIRAPDDWEIIQQNNGYAEIDVDVLIEDNPDDDTEIELDFSLSDIYARIVNEESGEFVTPLVRLAAEEKSYRCMFRKVPCGGPYLLDFVLFNKEKCIDAPLIGARRRHFYVGDVYIIAGQSNAAGMGKGFLSEEPETGIHVLRNLQYWDIASQPFNDFDYSKQSMFMAFAKKVRKQTGMPIGLIPAAMGGAPLSRWLKDENGDLYGKLVSCLKKHKIKARAMLWYQGCADVWNTSEPSDYIGRFKKFTEAVRLDIGDIPIFTFQLNRQKFRENTEENDLAYDRLREAQRRAAKEIPGVYVLPAIDALIMSDFIHCGKASNIMLGERLAITVLDKIYGIGRGADAPELLEAVTASDMEISLSFDNVTGFLYDFNSSLEDFPIKIEDEAGKVGITDFSIYANIIKIRLERELCGEAYVSGQSGSDPKNIIIDYGTQIPILCFSKIKILKGENR